MVIKEKEKMKKLLVILMCLVPLVGVGQYMKAPTHYDAQTAAGHIIKGHIKMYLNDSLTEVTVEKKNDRWVTSFWDKEVISKKVDKILQQGKPEFTGRTNGGYRFYINVYDVSDDTKVINSLDITIDAFTQQIKLIEIKL
jgi:hypothetical protein